MGPRLAFISPLAERCDNNNKWERDVEKKKKILCSSNGDNEGCLLLLCGVCHICSADESLNSFYMGLVCSSLFQTLSSRLARLQVPPTPVMTSRDPNQREFFQLLRLMKWNFFSWQRHTRLTVKDFSTTTFFFLPLLGHDPKVENPYSKLQKS